MSNQKSALRLIETLTPLEALCLELILKKNTVWKSPISHDRLYFPETGELFSLPEAPAIMHIFNEGNVLKAAKSLANAVANIDPDDYTAFITQHSSLSARGIVSIPTALVPYFKQHLAPAGETKDDYHFVQMDSAAGMSLICMKIHTFIIQSAGKSVRLRLIEQKYIDFLEQLFVELQHTDIIPGYL